MTHTRLTQDQLDTYRRALKGEVKLIGWGVRKNYFFHRWQEQYPLACLVDTTFELWDTQHEGLAVLNPLALRDHDPKSHAVINYYPSADVAGYAKRVAGITSLPPMPLQHILHELAKETDPNRTDAIHPLSKSACQTIIKNAPPFEEALDVGPLEQQKLLASYDWRDFVAGALASIPLEDTKDNTVVLACNSLNAGGAERQIVNCAVGLAQKGWEPHFLATMNNTTTPHYLAKLREHDISVTFAQEQTRLDNAHAIQMFLKKQAPQIRAILWHLPIEYISQIAATMVVLQRIKPRLVIAYLDWSNVIAGMAAVLCGVPEIIISGRSYAPQHYPHFFANVLHTFRDMHRILATRPNVHFTTNATDASRDYCEWLELSPSHMTTIPNSLTAQFLKRPKPEAIENLRKTWDIKRGDKIVLGVFRLSPEKRADKFIDILAILVKADPHVKGIICGDGILRTTLQKQARKLKLEDHIIFAGMTDNVQEMMNCADILLHPSPIEGMPNVMLEAQSQGLPVVSFRTGGVLECLAPELHEYSLEIDDWDGMTRAATTLLKKPALRKKLGATASTFICKNFSISKLVERNLALTPFGQSRTQRKRT